MVKVIFLANFISTIFMTGVIFVVQVVHYPLFSRVGSESFRLYAAEHNVLITYVVLPAMLIEAGTAVLLLFQRPKQMANWVAWAGIVFVSLIWISTFFVQVPQHTILLSGFNENAHTVLVNTNWIRTIGWSIRASLMTWILWKLVEFKES